MPAAPSGNFGSSFIVSPAPAPAPGNSGAPPPPGLIRRYVYLNSSGTFKIDGATGECNYTWYGTFNHDLISFLGFYQIGLPTGAEFGYLYQASNTPGYAFYFLFSDVPHYVGGPEPHYPIYFSWDLTNFFLWPSAGTVRHLIP